MPATESEPNTNHLSSNNIITNGLQAGIYVMATWLAFTGLFSDMNTLWQYAGYIILAAFIFKSITKHRLIIEQGKRFQNGIKIGFQVSIVAAITAVLINTIVALVDPSLAITKFNKNISDIFIALAVNFGIIIEFLVIGMLATFIILQGQKDSSSSRNVD